MYTYLLIKIWVIAIEAYGENMLTSKDGTLNITGTTLPIIVAGTCDMF